MSAKLFVGNLAPEATNTEISELFGTIGNVATCQLITDRETGNHKGFGFVEMGSTELASAAKSQLNGTELHGKTIKVDDARPRVR